MSLISYISFPNELDLNILNKIIPKSEYGVKEIKDMNLLEKNLFYKNNISDDVFIKFPQFFLSSLYIDNEKIIKSNKVFKNKYYYLIHGYFNYFQEPLINEYINASERVKNEMILIDWELNARATLCRNQLCKIIDESIKVNEIVEIYSNQIITNTDSFIFQKPQKIIYMNLDELFTSIIFKLDTNKKIEIKKTNKNN